MTNGRGAGMASFMTKKKKYKFQVDICLEELLEVPFVSAVLFAKLRLLDGGNFQDHSSREEVKDHKVKWGAKFAFPCKMLANATTGVLERCVLRISIRKESKGGRSYNKLGFADLNLAEFAGAGVTYKKALLEGYDTRHRQDNSMLKYSIVMNMLSGDILFKVPSPSLRPRSANEESVTDIRTEECSGGSLGGSIASGSSGFGSLPKKRPALLASELVIGQTLSENNIPITMAPDVVDVSLTPVANDYPEEVSCELGHSRNSSNTSQLSKASGYSSIHSHSHSRQSSSGDSGHIRNVHSSMRMSTIPKASVNSSKFSRTNTCPHKFYIRSNGVLSTHTEVATPKSDNRTHSVRIDLNDSNDFDSSVYATPTGRISSLSNEEYRTPDCTLFANTDIFSQDFIELQKSSSLGVVERQSLPSDFNVNSVQLVNKNLRNTMNVVIRSKSDYEINPGDDKIAPKIEQTNLLSFLTPSPKRKTLLHSTPHNSSPQFKPPPSPVFRYQLHSLPETTRTASLNSLRSNDGWQGYQDQRNPSSSSLALSETGSLDRAKAAYDRRKKNQAPDLELPLSSGRVENTRVNPDHLIEDLLKNTNLEPADDSAETSGLQLFIAKDGTAAVGNHDVKSQMSTGVQVFKQVVMNNR